MRKSGFTWLAAVLALVLAACSGDEGGADSSAAGDSGRPSAEVIANAIKGQTSIGDGSGAFTVDSVANIQYGKTLTLDNGVVVYPVRAALGGMATMSERGYLRADSDFYFYQNEFGDWVAESK